MLPRTPSTRVAFQNANNLFAAQSLQAAFDSHRVRNTDNDKGLPPLAPETDEESLADFEEPTQPHEFDDVSGLLVPEPLLPLEEEPLLLGNDPVDPDLVKELDAHQATLEEVPLVSLARSERVFFMDLEFHALDPQAPISQITVVSLDQGRSIVFNRYVFDRPLHRDWLELTERHGVELAPWNDPKRSKPWDVVLDELMDTLPSNACLVFKGPIDAEKMRLTLENQPGLSDERRKEVRHRCRRLRTSSVDHLWAATCQLLPKFVADVVLSNRITAAKEQSVFRDLMWTPVLVFQTGDQPEAVVDWPLPDEFHGPDQLVEVAVPDATARPEFLETGRREPLWHTAHTDVLIMRALTVFLVNYACIRRRLYQLACELRGPTHKWSAGTATLRRPETFAFHLYVTDVVRRTRWFRRSHPALVSHTARAFLVTTVLETALLLFDDDDEPKKKQKKKPKPPPAAPPSSDNAPSIREARRKRTRGVPVMHAGQWTSDVYDPTRFAHGRDEFKARAMRNLLGAQSASVVASVFQRIENERSAAGAPTKIGMRPWFYYPRATGSLGPRIQVLHTRGCTDRHNGNEYAEESKTSVVAFHDFDHIPATGVPGLRLQFCKVCKRYALPAPPEPEQPVSRGETEDLCLLLTLVVLACQRH